VGNIKWNATFAFGGMLIVFFLAWNNNLFHTALIRSIIAFVILFLFMFLFRAILGMIKVAGETEEQTDHIEEQVGSHVDLSTPEEESLTALFQADENESNAQSDQSHASTEQKLQQTQDELFKPIQPPKLTTS